jgi:hypothetical protein
MAGIIMAARMAMIAITTSSSINVKPSRVFVFTTSVEGLAEADRTGRGCEDIEKKTLRFMVQGQVDLSGTI